MSPSSANNVNNGLKTLGVAVIGPAMIAIVWLVQTEPRIAALERANTTAEQQRNALIQELAALRVDTNRRIEQQSDRLRAADDRMTEQLSHMRENTASIVARQEMMLATLNAMTQLIREHINQVAGRPRNGVLHPPSYDPWPPGTP